VTAFESPSLSGTVVGGDGAPIAGAIVRARRDGDGGEFSAVAGPYGDFRISGLGRDERYAVTAEIAGRVVERTGRIASDDLGVRIRLVPREQLVAGRLFRADGTPARWRWIVVVARISRAAEWIMTEDDGTFRTTEATPGDDDVFLAEPDRSGRSVPRTLLGRCRGGDADLVLRLPR
jgi:hypothetical protein